MSTIPAVSPKSDSGGTTPSPTQQTPVSDAKAQKDMFLKLMVAQIKNQDPLNPTDSSQFTAQLAQITSLEQLSYVREDVAKIADTLTGSADTTNSSQETK